VFSIALLSRSPALALPFPSLPSRYTYPALPRATARLGRARVIRVFL
jgi:hypothetical protein